MFLFFSPLLFTAKPEILYKLAIAKMIYVLFVDSKITKEFIESKIEHENRYLQNVLAMET